MDRKITINDVAEKAGVSRQTISRVLNNKGDVNETTRKRVLRIIEELDFQPSMQARSMVTRKTNTIALLIPDITNPFFSEIVRGIDRTVRATNINVLLFSTDEEVSREVSCIQLAQNYNVDGIILCSPRLDEINLRKLISSKLPVVLLNREIAEMNKVYSIIVDAQTGGYTAAKYLLDLGHRSIGILVGPAYADSSVKRLIGYKKALSDYAVPLDESLILHIDHQHDKIHENTQLLVKRNATAILAYNDMTAAKIIQSCTEMGLEVPKDISVIGFDGIPISRLVNPRLTTMDLPLYEMGEMIANTLMKMINGEETHTKLTVVLPLLKVGQSTRAIT
ncbi:LacI family DNA-binding transcriptional regulator [Paenibacillus agricola]|uniref:LacI family transcriptional regulator n=1 Tax=Paenibacillus agricola TaxID=2716264 RepID=A0ABX0JIU5_9BACL|nr:LacI family DNA-binding transcriptional regulator [Paenibacillus agricola]NHN34932.1 LacI family transcriptional regulator [Paenibacillus agricola]